MLWQSSLLTQFEVKENEKKKKKNGKTKGKEDERRRDEEFRERSASFLIGQSSQWCDSR